LRMGDFAFSDPGDDARCRATCPGSPWILAMCGVGFGLCSLNYPITKLLIYQFQQPSACVLQPAPHPTPAFFQLYCKQSTFANRRLGDPCVTLGWPLGDAWVTQSQSQSGRGSWAVFICPITKLPIYPILLRYRRKPAVCSIFIFQRASWRLHTLRRSQTIADFLERINSEFVSDNSTFVNRRSKPEGTGSYQGTGFSRAVKRKKRSFPPPKACAQPQAKSLPIQQKRQPMRY
jgi:hypothetical protein